MKHCCELRFRSCRAFTHASLSRVSLCVSWTFLILLRELELCQQAREQIRQIGPSCQILDLQLVGEVGLVYLVEIGLESLHYETKSLPLQHKRYCLGLPISQ